MIKYDQEFYKKNKVGSLNSAKIIVPIILKNMKIKSVVDIGCGTGTWLSEFIKHDVNNVLGIDGNWVDEKMLLIPKDKFHSKDLNQKFNLERKYDLAISLEVAEHIKKENSDIFIDNLCKLSDVILFSAAIPNQFGEGHINCNWQEYWIEKFEKRGYKTIDIIRNKVWNNEKVEYWYKQNTFLFAKNYEFKEELYEKSIPNNIVHPILLDKRSNDCKNILGKLFQEKEYEAIIKLKNIYNPYIYYYLGRCYIEKELYEQAIKYFNEFLDESNDEQYKISTCYYLGVIYFNMNNLDEAKKYFIICNKKSNDSHKMAKKYLERLK